MQISESSNYPSVYTFLMSPTRKMSRNEEASQAIANPPPTRFDPQAEGKSGLSAMPFVDLIAYMQKRAAGSDLFDATCRISANGAVKTSFSSFKADEITTRTATNTDGTKVSVTNIGADGENRYSLQLGSDSESGFSLDFSGDLRVGKEEGGAYLVYFSDTGKTLRFNTDGSIAAEFEGDITAASNHKIHIGTTGAELQGGDEDELFFILADNTTANCGSGNDRVILGANSNGVRLNLGSGANTVAGGNIFDGLIIAGDGDNEINVQGLFDTSIFLGEGDNQIKVIKDIAGGSLFTGQGNNTIQCDQALATEINLGDGNNQISIRQLRKNATLVLGDGNNEVDIYMVGTTEHSYFLDIALKGEISPDNFYESYISEKDSSYISIGNGNNNVKTYSITNNSVINLGSGNNSFTVVNIEHSSLHITDGSNTINLSEIKESHISIGNGNNIISLGHLTGSSTAASGHGNNYIKIYELADKANVAIGDGSNAIGIGVIHGYGKISVGDGRNDVTIREIRDNALISLGNGNNIVSVFMLRDSGLLQLGSGNNIVATGQMDSPSNISTGGGQNAIYHYEEMRANFSLYQSIEKQIESMRNKHFQSGLPSITNMKNVYVDMSRNVTLMQRVALLENYNAPKSNSFL